MNDSIKQLSLDFHQSSSREEVKIKKGDNKRQIRISLVDGGKPYRIADGCYAVFAGKKPDNNVVYNDCTIEGNVIIYELTEQTTLVPGLVKCEIKLYGADDKLITSPRFSIMVDDTVYDEGDEIESTDEFNALTKLISDALSLTGGGLNATARNLLITILRNAVYTSDQSANITTLETALASGGSGDNGGDDSGSISVTKNGTTLIISGVSSVLTVKQIGTTLALT